MKLGTKVDLLYLLPYMAIFTLLGFIYLTVDVGFPDPTSLSAMLIANTSLSLTGPVTAVMGVVLGNRLRSFSILHETSSRARQWSLAVKFAAPVFATAALSHFLVSVIAINGFSNNFNFVWFTYIEGFLILWFTLGWGWLLGNSLKLIYASLIAMGSTYFFLVLPITSSTPEWRHLIGLRHSCCQIDQVVDVRVQTITIFYYLFLITGLAVVTFSKRFTPIISVAIGFVLIGLSTIVGTTVIPISDFDAIQPRSRSELVCIQNSETQICVWPETQLQLLELSRESQVPLQTLRSKGFRVPSSFISTTVVLDSEASFRLSSRATLEQNLASFISSIVPHPSETCLHQDIEILNQTQLARALILELSELKSNYFLDEENVQLKYKKLRGLPDVEKIKFVKRAIAQVGECDS